VGLRRAGGKGLGPIGLAAAMLSLAMVSLAIGAHALSPQEQFRQAGALVRGGDYPKAIAIYGGLAASGSQSASLYWNWAQAALARGAQGEALWALLRARELDPSDRAVGREIERLREAANLDRAELAPEPLAALARVARRFRLDAIALLLLLVSLAAHAGHKWWRTAAGLATLAWTTLTVGLLVAVVPVAGSMAHPTGTVIRRGAPMLDAASPTAEAVGTLREGEVVPILESSGDYVRVEDSSGARGWALSADVRPVEAAPKPAS
jgi:hypothetical protein